jgi:radical SAM superfamily enzyme YgiQ (UPF0313 family)
MKLSRYYKEKGEEVVLTKKRAFIKQADKVFASCIFNSETSRNHVRALKKYYGRDINIGGSGVDLKLRLPEAIEKMPADYDLYPELKDRAIGFITRGCPHKCKFCVVPIKEGAPRIAGSISSLNMKSMENYYRWVSRNYALTFGRRHQGLVDTIFKYNHRSRGKIQKKGVAERYFYISTLQ